MSDLLTDYLNRKVAIVPHLPPFAAPAAMPAPSTTPKAAAREDVGPTRQFQFIVTITVGEDVTERDARDYVEEAVSGWNGSYRPPGAFGPEDAGHPLWSLLCNSVQNLARTRFGRGRR